MTYLDQQTPLGSGFGPTSTTDEIIDGIDLSGRVAVVTGGYRGSVGKRCERFRPPVPA